MNWILWHIDVILESVREYFSRRRQRRMAIRLMEKSGVLRRADHTVRHAVSQSKIDAIFPVLPADKVYLKGMRRP